MARLYWRSCSYFALFMFIGVNYLILSYYKCSYHQKNENLNCIIDEDAYPYSFRTFGESPTPYNSSYEHCNRLLVNDFRNWNETRRLVPLKDIKYYLDLNSAKGNSCQAYKAELHMDEIPILDEEVNFPLAFSFLLYKDINQVARLLRILYRPQNYYAIHVDTKSSVEFYNAVVEIQRCLGTNVYVIPRKESVAAKWGTYTLQEIEFICAAKLLQMGKWKYLINLTGQEFPLRTNLELVRALRAINGSNIAEAIIKKRNMNRIPNVTFDFNVTWVKGAVHAVLKYEFVDFMLSDAKAISIASALKNYSYDKSPVELFYSTLVYNPHLRSPGACLEVHEKTDPDAEYERLGLIMRYKTWVGDPCPTKFLRTICILGSAHLNILFHAKELFANKFLEDYYPEAYDCLELMIANRANSKHVLDTSVYKNLYCSQAHI